MDNVIDALANYETEIDNLIDKIKSDVRDTLINNSNNDIIDEGLNLHRQTIMFHKEIKDGLLKIENILSDIDITLTNLKTLSNTFRT